MPVNNLRGGSTTAVPTIVTWSAECLEKVDVKLSKNFHNIYL